MHLRLGSLDLSRVELETLAGLGGLDPQGLVDLAEVRWRTGDLLGAGEAAAAALRVDGSDPTALVVAAEAASAIGRPGEARRLATRAMAAAPGAIDQIFAGMPRSGVWPTDANEPAPTAPTLFDRGPELAVPAARVAAAAPEASARPGRHEGRDRTDDTRALGQRRGRGCGRRRSRPARPGAGVRGRTRRPRRRLVRRGGAAVRPRPAPGPGTCPGRPGGDRGCSGVVAVGRPR